MESLSAADLKWSRKMEVAVDVLSSFLVKGKKKEKEMTLALKQRYEVKSNLSQFTCIQIFYFSDDISGVIQIGIITSMI